MSDYKKVLEILQDGAERWAQRAFSEIHSAICESPIEQALLAAFMAEQASQTSWPAIFVGVVSEGKEFDAALPLAENILNHRHHNIECVILPQVGFGQYRADFIAFGLDINGIVSAVAIECDGHEFHEKTKEQAQRDKLRDRTFLGRDIPVMRFTGSEIWRDAPACVSQVQEYFRHLAFQRKAV